ncbi:DNA-binding protein [Streptomyces sp. SID1328]|uniref:BRO-N domain-containing protein n=1 Tax=Streptomyces sp. SID1328 TaxID=2690250 RepID=UPI001367DC65|nr:Bro-N domain-containing protein [Streptomyces sp. SID1328]MYV42331.1 DNA-binding protein [Streptomyces sp. SID1328]
MYEHNDRTRQPERGAIAISDFVYAATGARLRRLTTPDGEHWFPAVDVCKHLGYAHTGSTLRNIVDPAYFSPAESVLLKHTLSIPAGREWRRDMNLVNLHGLIQLVNGSTKPESQPFKAWVSDVIVTIQRDGTYSLDPAPLQTTPGTSYVMPAQVADAIVRLEERNLRADEALAAAQAEHLVELRRANDERSKVSEQLGALTHQVTGLQHVLTRIADALDQIVDRVRPAPLPEPRAPLTPQHLLATWRDRNLVVTEDVHAVAAHLAPALVHGPVACRLEDVAARTGLTRDRVHDCVRMLIKRGCVRQSGSAADGVPVYSLP